MSTLSATNRSRQQVLGYPVDVVDEGLALEVIEDAWRAGRGLHIVTLNAEMVVAAQQNSELDRIIRHAHLIIPDGAGVVWAVRLGGGSVNRLPGIELAQASLSRAALRKKRVALLGGKPEVLEKLKRELPARYPGLEIVAVQHGYFGPDDEETIVENIAEQAPDLVLVALGVPKQEFFIDRWNAVLSKSVLVGVGGSFDVWAGNVKRAPLFMRRMHLEWLYRLLVEPWRWRRMGSSLPSFGLQVLRHSMRQSKHRHNHDESRKSRSSKDS